jgi:hypothetical protein
MPRYDALLVGIRFVILTQSVAIDVSNAAMCQSPTDPDPVQWHMVLRPYYYTFSRYGRNSGTASYFGAPTPLALTMDGFQQLRSNPEYGFVEYNGTEFGGLRDMSGYLAFGPGGGAWVVSTSHYSSLPTDRETCSHMYQCIPFSLSELSAIAEHIRARQPSIVAHSTPSWLVNEQSEWDLLVSGAPDSVRFLLGI